MGDHSFFFELVRQAASMAWVALGTNGFGWAVALAIPFLVVFLRLFSKPRGERLSYFLSEWRFELRDVAFVIIGVFLIVVFWKAVWVIPRSIDSRASTIQPPTPPPPPSLPIIPSLAIPSLTNASINVIGACHLDADRSPCELICSASNPSSQLAAHEVTMGFNRLIPVETGVSASPEDRVTLQQSNTLPIQNANGKFPDFRAFTVNIPMIPPASKVEFTVWTNDIGNKKACSEQQLVQKHRRKVMAAYFAAVSKRQPTVKTPDIDQLLLADTKEENLFHPDIIESDRGKQKVEFVTKADEKTTLLAQSVYKLLPNYQDVLAPEKKWECMAPVYEVEQTGGRTTTFSELLPLSHASITFELLLDPQNPAAMQKQSPKQPEDYACSP